MRKARPTFGIAPVMSGSPGAPIRRAFAPPGRPRTTEIEIPRFEPGMVLVTNRIPEKGKLGEPLIGSVWGTVVLLSCPRSPTRAPVEFRVSQSTLLRVLPV